MSMSSYRRIMFTKYHIIGTILWIIEQKFGRGLARMWMVACPISIDLTSSEHRLTPRHWGLLNRFGDANGPHVVVKTVASCRVIDALATTIHGERLLSVELNVVRDLLTYRGEGELWWGCCEPLEWRSATKAALAERFVHQTRQPESRGGRGAIHTRYDQFCLKTEI